MKTLSDKAFAELTQDLRDAWLDSPAPAEDDFCMRVMQEIRKEPIFEPEPTLGNRILIYAERIGLGLATVSVVMTAIVFRNGNVLNDIPVDQLLRFVG